MEDNKDFEELCDGIYAIAKTVIAITLIAITVCTILSLPELLGR